jgi:hypothetical protein
MTELPRLILVWYGGELKLEGPIIARQLTNDHPYPLVTIVDQGWLAKHGRSSALDINIHVYASRRKVPFDQFAVFKKETQIITAPASIKVARSCVPPRRRALSLHRKDFLLLAEVNPTAVPLKSLLPRREKFIDQDDLEDYPDENYIPKRAGTAWHRP